MSRVRPNYNMAVLKDVSRLTEAVAFAWMHSQDLQAIIDGDGTIQAANAAWTTLLGWNVGDVIGRSFMKFSPTDLNPVEIRCLIRLRQHRRTS